MRPGFAAFIAAVLLAATPLVAQEDERDPPPPVNAATHPALTGFQWRSVGPVGQGGRVNDIAVVEADPTTFFVGFATGGLWKTTNNGTTFRPVFDSQGTHSIGAVAVSQSDPDVVWVGTGEANNRQSSSFGDGVYRSTDGGETWAHVGLRETQSIARVVVHPTDPGTAWVAAVGQLFSANPERGVFKTTDGGETWRHVLSVDEHTGATDLILHPTDPRTLFAATYQRRRTAWGFVGGGPGSGLWRSDDAGETWNRVEGNGLPSGTLGRIGIDISRSNPDVLYAQIEVAPDDEPAEDEPERGGGRFGGGEELPPDPGVSGVWKSTDGGATWTFLNNHNPRPMYFSQIRVDPTDPEVVYTAGVRFYESTDGGQTFEELEGYGHVDHHAIWIDPNDGRHLMIGNDGSVDVSWDRAETWESLRSWSVGQPYHVSVDMRRPYYVCTGLQDNGTWCGPSHSRGGPILAQDWYRVGGGDGFYTQVDPEDWTVVYSESQNGNIRRSDLKTGETTTIRPTAPRRPGSGRRGFGGGEANIVPEPEAGLEIRWNWNTPFTLSPHNPRVIHAGGNRLFTSLDRGETWTMSRDLTKDLDPDSRPIMGRDGDEPRCGRARVGACILSRDDGVGTWGTIVSVSESTIVPGLLWVGTDDGNIQVSRDGGATWDEVSRNLPGGTTEYYVSRVEASHHDPATAYVSIDGHRHGDLRPYVYVTRDYGASWTSIASDLPDYGNVNTVRQDPVNPDLLYAGTEFGFFVSMDEGGAWHRFMTGLPVVRVDDVVVHPRENDLVLATHGRSIWILDDVTPIQQLTPEVVTEDLALLQPRDFVDWADDPTRSRSVTGAKVWRGDGAPDGTAIAYWLGAFPEEDVELTVTDVRTGEVFRTLEATTEAGLNVVRWDGCGDTQTVQRDELRSLFSRASDICGGFGGFRRGGDTREVAFRAEPGLYRVTLTVGDDVQTRNVRVLEDVWIR